MKKRVLALLLAMAMVLSLAACNKSGTDSKPDTASNSEGQSSQGSASNTGVTDEKITLSFWSYEDETTANLMAEKFMEHYPNITVETYIIQDMSTDLSAAAASGTFPDVFEGTDSDTALANQYWLDISQYFDADPENNNLMPTVKE